jgi:hypothetical protein
MHHYPSDRCGNDGMSDRDALESKWQDNGLDVILQQGDVHRERLIRIVEHILAAPLPEDEAKEMRELLEELKNPVQKNVESTLKPVHRSSPLKARDNR